MMNEMRFPAAAGTSSPESKEPQVVTGIEISSDEPDGLEVPFLKGEHQEPAYRDLAFARVFYLQLLGVLLTACFYGPALFNDNTALSEDDETEKQNEDLEDLEKGEGKGSFLFVLALAGVATIASTSVCLSLMLRYPHEAVKISFFIAPVLAVMTGLALMVAPGNDEDRQALAQLFFLFALFWGFISGLIYMFYRRFMPFASSTLHSAMTALRVNRGLYVLPFGFLALTYAWSVIWLIALLGVSANANAKGGCDETEGEYSEGEYCDENAPNLFALLSLFLAFYWTQQVIQNVLHCTTAGTVGSWWFSTFGDPSCWSHELSDALVRALTYSFGSICFGSLLVAIIQLLEHMARSSRHNRRGALLACVVECILYIIRRWVEYFNSWAFVYVGLYGYDYLTAGKNVISMFRAQGWSSFVSDRLVFRVLYAAHLGVAFVAGIVAAVADLATGPIFGYDPDPNVEGAFLETGTISHMVSFFVGFLAGLILSGVSLFVIESAVRTIIVCFAENPAEFQEHHPDLCEEMRAGWSAAYPEAWTEEMSNRLVVSVALLPRQDKTPDHL